MSGNGRASNGRGNNRRRPFRQRNNEATEGHGSEQGNNPNRAPGKPQEKKARSKWPDENQNHNNFSKYIDTKRNEKAASIERPKWVPPKVNTDPLPVPDCPYCGKPIQDISQAIGDKGTDVPVHFDCIADKIAKTEILEKDDSVTYIGGGRFGVVVFSGKTDFKIKKIIEWENKDKRAEWRSEICDHYLAN